jgi:hypothetical protein
MRLCIQYRYTMFTNNVRDWEREHHRCLARGESHYGVLTVGTGAVTTTIGACGSTTAGDSLLLRRRGCGHLPENLIPRAQQCLMPLHHGLVKDRSAVRS